MLRAGIAENVIGEEFNLASEVETKIRDLAEKINSLTNNPAGIKFMPKRKWDTKSRLLASVDKARKLIGYEPNTNFDEGLKTTIKWFQDNEMIVNPDKFQAIIINRYGKLKQNNHIPKDF